MVPPKNGIVRCLHMNVELLSKRRARGRNSHGTAAPPVLTADEHLRTLLLLDTFTEVLCAAGTGSTARNRDCDCGRDCDRDRDRDKDSGLGTAGRTVRHSRTD